MNDPTTIFGWMMYGAALAAALLASFAALAALARADAQREADEETMPDSRLWRPRF